MYFKVALRQFILNSYFKDYGRTEEQIKMCDFPTPINIDVQIDGAEATKNTGYHLYSTL